MLEKEGLNKVGIAAEFVEVNGPHSMLEYSFSRLMPKCGEEQVKCHHVSGGMQDP